MTPARLRPVSFAVAESLRTSSFGLSAVITLAPPEGARARVGRMSAALRRDGLRACARCLSGTSWLGPAPSPRPRLFPKLAWTTTTYAAAHRVPTWTVPESDHPATVAAIHEAELDVVVPYAAGILRPMLLDVDGVTFLNAHDGRVPRYRGMHCCLWAIYNHDPIYATVHRMDHGIDTGDVLLEAPLAIGRPRTIDELFKVAYSAPWSLLAESLEGLAGGTLAFTRQSEHEPATQWFSMHPSLMAVVQAKLEDGGFFDLQEGAVRERLGPGAGTEPPGWWRALIRQAEESASSPLPTT